MSLGGLFSTSKTGLTLTVEDRHPVDLLGPLAALAAPVALHCAGEMRGRCALTPETSWQLQADEAGIHTRHPASLALFLPAWQPGMRPAEVMASGVFLQDDEALAEWQSQHGEPPGMPVLAMLFAMAAAEIGTQLGGALSPLFSELPNFD